MTNLICNTCDTEFELSTGGIFYDGKFFHKKCDPFPNIKCLGIVSNNLVEK